jgi:release factor glutamine methyltransferase
VTTLAQAQADVSERLRAAGVPSPDVDARWLVEAAVGKDPRRSPEAPLEDDGARMLAALVARRSAREPLQLVLGTTAFRDLELRCRPGVFIPRPETEVLAGIAIGLVEQVRAERAGASASDAVTPAVVLEPCCGTGAVGLAVASATAHARITIADRAPAAVSLAEENRAMLAAGGRLRSPVTVRAGALLDAFDPADRGRVDVLVANPPYLPEADLRSMEPEVAGHDPHEALFGGPQGHEIVDLLLSAALDWLIPGGAVALEIDARRSAVTLDRARSLGLVAVEAHPDLTGAERFVVARRPGPAGSGR